MSAGKVGGGSPIAPQIGIQESASKSLSFGGALADIFKQGGFQVHDVEIDPEDIDDAPVA